MAELRDAPSPNHDARAAGTQIEILLLHYTGMASGAAALARLTDAAARISAHYLVEEDGRVFRLVDEARRAWHAGVSCWRGRGDVNSRSIGIELVNPGHAFGYRPFPAPQMVALRALAGEILARHPIPPDGVLGHADVAPTRREDPGELFDWAGLAAAGIGLAPRPAPLAGSAIGPGSPAQAVLRLQADLARLGYCLEASGVYDDATRAVVRALQRHWRPSEVSGLADAETRAMLAALLDRSGRSA